jgi:hypothetical protein
MRTQLDILALEPFYGGVRRAMLTAIMRCSRHRWTLLKLPPRRIERRLTTAANWFAEQLSRHFSGHVDVLFTSDAMNLANLFRLVPDLASRPSVVYFHDNHLPDLNSTTPSPFDLVNLNTATAASEIWFNSAYHLKIFLTRAAALVARHPELSSRDPMRAISEKAQLMPAPMDLGYVGDVRGPKKVERDASTIFVETRGADVKLLNGALELLHGAGRHFKLITVGPVEQLSPQWERKTIREIDEPGQVLGMLEAGVQMSIRPAATSDYLFMRGMLAGCRAVAPDGGVYPELIPETLHSTSLYQPYPADIARKLSEALRANGLPVESTNWRRAFKPFDAIPACRLIDDRMDRLAQAGIFAD